MILVRIIKNPDSQASPSYVLYPYRFEAGKKVSLILKIRTTIHFGINRPDFFNIMYTQETVPDIM